MPTTSKKTLVLDAGCVAIQRARYPTPPAVVVHGLGYISTWYILIKHIINHIIKHTVDGTRGGQGETLVPPYTRGSVSLCSPYPSLSLSLFLKLKRQVAGRRLHRRHPNHNNYHDR